MSNLLKFVSSRLFVTNSTIKNITLQIRRTFVDKVDKPKTKAPKQVVVQGSENEDKLRVRRARAADVPRVLKFVQQHARATWPGVPPPPSSVSHVILCDYVARALSQGHSMIAEQLETRKGWSHLQGLALSASVCSWDASMLERWSKCVRCTRSRRLMQFTAHILRAPALHDKYHVHNLLQVILIVPRDHPKCSEIVLDLMKSSIKRGQEIGFPLVRFDCADPSIAKILDDLNLKKEWELSFDSETLEKEKKQLAEKAARGLSGQNFIAVYSVFTDKLSEQD